MTYFIKVNKNFLVSAMVILGVIRLLSGNSDIVAGDTNDPDNLRKGDIITMDTRFEGEWNPVQNHVIMYSHEGKRGIHWFLEAGPANVHFAPDFFIESLWKNFFYWGVIDADENIRKTMASGIRLQGSRTKRWLCDRRQKYTSH